MSTKVTEFGANQKWIIDFLLAINSNIGRSILHCFKDIARFLLKTATPSIFYAKFVDIFPWIRLSVLGLRRERRPRANPLISFDVTKVYGHDIRTLQTDRRTDRQH